MAGIPSSARCAHTRGARENSGSLISRRWGGAAEELGACQRVARARPLALLRAAGGPVAVHDPVQQLGPLLEHLDGGPQRRLYALALRGDETVLGVGVPDPAAVALAVVDPP